MTSSRRFQRHGAIKGECHTSVLCSSDDPNAPILNTQAPLPQHCTLPDIQALNEVAFQLGYFANSIVLLCFQYLNIYNTIWWMPHSKHQYAVDFDSIDMDLVILIALLLSYRLLKSSLDKVFDHVPTLMGKVAKLAVLCIYYLPVCGTFLLITKSYTIKCWIFLLVPVVVYFLLFGPNLNNYIVKLLPWWPCQQLTSRYDIMIPQSNAKTSKNIFHACSMNPENVRREVYILKNDFNYRLKLVYYEAMFTVYYCTIIPAIFCRSLHHTDLTWMACFILVSALTMALIGFVQRVPASYIDALHKSAVHLGHWRKHEERLVNIPHSVWSELTVWPKGANVKHVKGLFKAEGINNTAEPGNSMHSKFYAMFKQPEYVCAVIAVLSVLNAMFGFLMLSEFKYWYQLLATAGLMLSNYYSLFLSIRDYMILTKVYKSENEHIE